MAQLRIGIIGAGRIGKVHAQSISYHIPEAKVLWVTDLRLEAAKALAETLGIPNYSSDYHDILQDPQVDAVLICSPTDTHADIVIEACAAKKHIFCEKPVDLTIEKILKAKAAVEKAGVCFQVGFNRRFDHNHKKVRDSLQSGKLGKAEIIKITSRDPAPPSAEYARQSGGLFIDMMIHDFDMAMYLSGSDVEEVYTLGACLVDPAIGEAGDVDTAIVTLKFTSGALGVIDNSRRAKYGYDQRVEIFGEKGMALDENDTDTRVIISTEEGVCLDKPQYFFLERYMGSFVAEMKAFIESIKENKTPPVGIHEGLMSVVLAKAARKSYDEKRPVKISEFLS